jgi:hypothetical protein
MLNVKNIIRGLVIGCVVVVGCIINSNVAKADTVDTINTCIISVDSKDNKEIDTVEVNGNTYRFYGCGWHVGDLCSITMNNDKIVNSKMYVNEWLYDKNTDEPTMVKLDELISNGTIQIDETNYSDVLKNILYKDNNKVMTHYTVDNSWYVINEYNSTYGCHDSVNDSEQWFKSEEDLIQYIKENWNSNGKMNR